MVPPRFKYIIYSYLNPALSGRKCSGVKHSFIVFGFVRARRGLIYRQVCLRADVSSGASIMLANLRIK